MSIQRRSTIQRRQGSKILALLLFLLWLPGCSQPAGQPGAATGTPPARPEGNTLVVGKPGDPKGLDPADVTDAESSQITANLFDTLLRFKSGSAEVEPSLATEWKASPDGKTWTLKLRQGVKFHDGTPFNARAVVDNFERQYVANHPLRYPGATFSYWSDVWGGRITKIEAVDEHTVRFHLKEPIAPFLSNLAMPFFGIASPAALKKSGRDAFKQPVGTGPFKFVEWLPGDRLVIEANQDYWDGRPPLDRITFKPIPENTSRQLQLERGAVQLITGLQLENYPELSKNPAVKVAEQPGLNLGYLSFNTQKKPLDDPKVRQALCLAVNRQQIVDELYHGLAKVANSPVPPGIWGRKELPYEYNPDTARELLKEAGHEGLKLEISYMSVPRTYFPEPKVIAEVLQAQWGEVGIQVDVKSREWSSYLEALGQGEHQVGLSGWIADNGDPDNFLYTLFDSGNVDTKRGGSNVCMYTSEEVHGLLVKAQALTDQAERTKLYEKAQELIHQDAPCLPMVYVSQLAASHPELEGFELHPTGTLQLRKARWKSK